MRFLMAFLFSLVLGLFSGCSDRDNHTLKKESEIIEPSNGKNTLQTAVPPLPNEGGVNKILSILEEIHNHCKGKAQYNECFCERSNFSGTVIIDGTKYNCRRNVSQQFQNKHIEIVDSAKTIEQEKRKEVQGKFNQHAQCLKSKNVNILEDSVRFKFVFDSCWTEYMQE